MDYLYQKVNDIIKLTISNLIKQQGLSSGTIGIDRINKAVGLHGIHIDVDDYQKIYYKGIVLQCDKDVQEMLQFCL